MNWNHTKKLAAVVLLLLGAGTLNRWVHRARAEAGSIYRPLYAPLSTLPSQLGPYTHKGDLPLAPEILEVADVDRFVYREYRSKETAPPLLVYIGYWGRQNRGTGHGPEICYPAAGWRPAEAVTHRALRFGRVDGTSTEAVVAMHRFDRMEPEGLRRVSTGFVAVHDGRFLPSSRGEFAHRPPSSKNEGFLAHILVSTSVDGTDWSGAERRIVDFIGRLLPPAATCLLGDGTGANGISARQEVD